MTDVAGIVNITHVAETVKLTHVARILEASSMYDHFSITKIFPKSYDQVERYLYNVRTIHVSFYSTLCK